MSDTGSSIFKKIVKGFIYVLVLLFIAEMFYRFFWTDPPMTEVVYGNHPTYHHVPKMFLKSGLGEMDYRKHPYQVEKPADTIRVAFIGDSFTYSFTPANETIPHYLRKMVQQKYPDKKVEILNFGFVSYSPLIEEVVYRRLVSQLKCDYVIQLYDTFDPQDDILYSKSTTFDENGVPLAVAGEEFLKTGIRASALVRFVQFAYELIKNNWHYLPKHQRFESRIEFLLQPKDLQELIGYSFSVIKRLATKVKQDGSKFLLFQYPPPHLMQDLSEFQNFMASWGINSEWQPPKESPFTPLVLDFCRKEQLNCYDFGPNVRKMEQNLGENGSRLKIYNNRDGHFTGFANLDFAGFILEKLESQGFPSIVNN